MEVRARSAARSWNTCKYMYISYVSKRSLRQQVILEAPIEGVRDEAEGVSISVPTQQLELSLPAARSTTVRHTLGIFMPCRSPVQADPAGEHIHDC